MGDMSTVGKQGQKHSVGTREVGLRDGRLGPNHRRIKRLR